MLDFLNLVLSPTFLLVWWLYAECFSFLSTLLLSREYVPACAFFSHIPFGPTPLLFIPYRLVVHLPKIQTVSVVVYQVAAYQYKSAFWGTKNVSLQIILQLSRAVIAV